MSGLNMGIIKEMPVPLYPLDKQRHFARRIAATTTELEQHYNSNQIEFINLIINRLVEHGIVEVSLLYESPITDVAPQGPEGIFTADQIQKIIRLLDDIRSTAMAA